MEVAFDMTSLMNTPFIIPNVLLEVDSDGCVAQVCNTEHQRKEETPGVSNPEIFVKYDRKHNVLFIRKNYVITL